MQNNAVELYWNSVGLSYSFSLEDYPISFTQAKSWYRVISSPVVIFPTSQPFSYSATFHWWLWENSHTVSSWPFILFFFFLQLLEFLKRILVVHYLLTPWNGFLMGEILHWGLFGIKSFLISLNHNSWSTFKEMTYTASDGNLKLYVCEINLSHKKLYGNFWIWALQSFNPWLYLKCHFSSLLRVIWRGPEDKVYWLIVIRLITIYIPLSSYSCFRRRS